MFELRWVKTGQFETNGEPVLKLQYRLKEPKFYGTRDAIPYTHDWSQWIDVPTVEDQA